MCTEVREKLQPSVAGLLSAVSSSPRRPRVVSGHVEPSIPIQVPSTWVQLGHCLSIPVAEPWSSQLWKMLEVWGKCGLMLFCHQGARSHALAGMEGGWYMHAWAKIERKEQVSYFTEALEKRLLLL